MFYRTRSLVRKRSRRRKRSVFSWSQQTSRLYLLERKLHSPPSLRRNFTKAKSGDVPRAAPRLEFRGENHHHYINEWINDFLKKQQIPRYFQRCFMQPRNFCTKKNNNNLRKQKRIAFYYYLYINIFLNGRTISLPGRDATGVFFLFF